MVALFGTGRDEEADSDMLAAGFSLVTGTAATGLQAPLNETPCGPSPSHPQSPLGPHRHAPWPAEGAPQGTGVNPDLALQAYAAGLLVSQCLVTHGRLQLLPLLGLSLCKTVFRNCSAYLASMSTENPHLL